MKIGIDISQLAYPNTGVSNYLENLVLSLVKNSDHKFILFFSSFRGNVPQSVLEITKQENVVLVQKKIPPTLLNIMWNIVHKIPIESFTGPLDLFLTSDWTEPPSKIKKATIIYDLIVYKYPNETDEKIIKVQKKKLYWVKKESDIIFCISESTKNDVHEILGIEKEKLKVIYPGITLWLIVILERLKGAIESNGKTIFYLYVNKLNK